MRDMRAQVQRSLCAVPVKRKPALRRSDRPDALLATDLPLVAETEDVAAFCGALEAQGWTVREDGGWLTLDASVPLPAECVVPAELTGPCGCCISLLLRHPDNAPAQDFIRAVVKAAEAGKMPFERLCGQLHAEFAARLRRHEALPGALLAYLCHACRTLYM